MTQSNSHVKFLAHPNGRLAYRDEGHGETIVFVHGTPTSSLEYVGLIDRLKDSYRLPGDRSSWIRLFRQTPRCRTIPLKRILTDLGRCCQSCRSSRFTWCYTTSVVLLDFLGTGQHVRDQVTDNNQFLGLAVDRLRTADAFAALDTSIQADGLALLTT